MKSRLSGGKPGQVFFNTREGLVLLLLKNRTEGYVDEYGDKDPNGDTLHLENILTGEEFTINSRGRFAEIYYLPSEVEQENIVKLLFIQWQ